MCFLIKKIFDDDKFFIYMVDFLCEIEILLLKMCFLIKNIDNDKHFLSI